MNVYVEERLVIRDLEVAKSFFKRLRGMIQRPISALYFPHCNSVHTFFMQKPIDIVFLDRQYRIQRISREVEPRRFRMSGKSAHVLELDATLADKLDLRVGDSLRFEEH